MASKQMIKYAMYFVSRKNGESTVLSIMIPRDQDWPLHHGVLLCFKSLGAISILVYNRNMNRLAELRYNSKHIHLWTFLDLHHSTKILNLYWLFTFAWIYFLIFESYRLTFINHMFQFFRDFLNQNYRNIYQSR